MYPLSPYEMGVNVLKNTFLFALVAFVEAAFLDCFFLRKDFKNN